MPTRGPAGELPMQSGLFLPALTAGHCCFLGTCTQRALQGQASSSHARLASASLWGSA